MRAAPFFFPPFGHGMDAARSPILQSGAPLVIGHRGAAAVLPENTLPSIAHALALDVDAVEFDVRLSADGVPVVHHDPTTERTCGDALDIATSPLAALRSLDAAATFPGASSTRIPLLDEVLELTHGRPIIIECKTDAVAPAVVTAVRAHGATDRAIVGSYRHAAMQTARRAGMSSSASRRDMLGLLARAVVGRPPASLPFAAMCIPEQSGVVTLPIARFAAWGRTLGVPVHVWTVNDPAVAVRLWRVGVTGILSDAPAVILAARAEYATR